MKVSIVIPVYNEEDYIEECLQSIFSLPTQPHEIIVVNNNSSDRSVEIVEQFNVTLLHEKEQGMTPARNCGYNAATGDIIARLDADCRVPHNWLDVIIENFEQQPDIVALSGLLCYYDSPIPDSTTAARIYLQTAKTIYKHNVLFGGGHALRNSAWEKVKDDVCLDDEIVHEDIDLSIHLAEIGKIHFDKNFVTSSSARRIKGDPKSFFIEYGLRHPKILKHHKEIMQKRHKILGMVSKIPHIKHPEL